MTINIEIFKELTTDEHIQSMIERSKTYDGLYVDMNNAKERKFVKDMADEINQLLKRVDRKRIDASKEYKLKVEAQAAHITEQLNIANAPFVSLINEHKAERKKILDAEKAEAEAKAAAAQYVIDHEFGLLMNDKFDADKIAELAAQTKRDNEMKAAAIEQEKQARMVAEESAKSAAEKAEIKRVKDVENARLVEIKRQEDEALRIENERLKREADKAHSAKINNEILSALASSMRISDDDAKFIIKLIANKRIPHLTINY